MDSEDEDYEFDVDPVVTSEQYHTLRYGDLRATTSSPSPSSSSENEDEYDIPTTTTPLIQAMDIPSVRRPPVSVMVPADRVPTHDLPLAESLSAVVNREKYHSTKSIHRPSRPTTIFGRHRSTTLWFTMLD